MHLNVCPGPTFSFQNKQYKNNNKNKNIHLNVCPGPTSTINNKRKARTLFSSGNNGDEIPEGRHTWYLSQISVLKHDKHQAWEQASNVKLAF